MAAAAAEVQRLCDAVNSLVVGTKPPRDFPRRLSAPAPPPSITLDQRQNQRFDRNKFLAEVAGRTTAGAGVGSGQAVIAKAGPTEVHFYCLSKGAERVLEMVDRNHVALIHQDTDLRAWDRLSQVNALTSAEKDGLITHAEADMAARHIGAYKAALRVCKQNLLYESDGVSDNKLGTVDAKRDAMTLLERFNKFHDAEVGHDVFAHAISFYNTHRIDFPREFEENRHLDWFIVWYRDVVWNATLQRIDRIEPQVIIANLGRVLGGQRRGDMVLRSSIIKRDNLDSARWTSEIAMNDARPAIYAGDASRSSPWEDLQRLDFIDVDESNEDELKFVSFTDRVVPHNVSHWREWSSYFWSTRRVPRLGAPNPIRPSVLSLIPLRAARAIIQYKGYEESFEKWSEDVVAYLVYKEMRKDAESGDTFAMASKFRAVNWMMKGKSASAITGEYDENEEEKSSDSEEDSEKDSGEEDEDEDERSESE